jgi:inhibitor of KinA
VTFTNDSPTAGGGTPREQPVETGASVTCDVPDVRWARAPKLFDVGECALVVEFGQVIDPTTNDRVIALDHALSRAAIPGVLEVVPTYRSLMIHYDPLAVPRDDLAARVKVLLSERPEPRKPRRWTFPVCYDETFGIDLAAAAWALGLPASRIVELHSSVTYRIYMHGFAPGLPALGGLPEALRLPRFMTPRQSVPPGSVIIVLNQASIASVDMPCAWHVIGRTPERLFVLGREPTVLTETGDEIEFQPVDMHTFGLLEQRAGAGETVARVVG